MKAERYGAARRRSEAAKKAWATRRRLAKPTAVMRRWLGWLARRPENVVVARYDSRSGTRFGFGAFPDETIVPQPTYFPFTRGTFFALQRRGWVEQFHRTSPRDAGLSFKAGNCEVRHVEHRTYWRITDKGRRALGP